MVRLKRKKPTKASIEHAKKYIGQPNKILECKQCFDEVTVPADVESVICDFCVQLMCAPPESIVRNRENKNKEKRPRGWQFKKKYVSPSGKIYSFGKEISKKKLTKNKL